MGNRFKIYKTELEKERANHTRATAEADEQFKELLIAVGKFNADTVLDLVFDWNPTQRWLELGAYCLGLESARDKEPRKIWFGEVPPHDNPPFPKIIETWSIQPEIDMFDGFRWKVSELNESFNTQELADEAAIQLTNMAMRRSGQRS